MDKQEKKTYSKKQILEATKHKDLCMVLLEDNKVYSLDEVDKMIDKYLKRKVK